VNAGDHCNFRFGNKLSNIITSRKFGHHFPSCIFVTYCVASLFSA